MVFCACACVRERERERQRERELHLDKPESRSLWTYNWSRAMIPGTLNSRLALYKLGSEGYEHTKDWMLHRASYYRSMYLCTYRGLEYQQTQVLSSLTGGKWWVNSVVHVNCLSLYRRWYSHYSLPCWSMSLAGHVNQDHGCPTFWLARDSFSE